MVVPSDAGSEVAFERAITLESRSQATAEGWVEDDFHHFGVQIQHDGEHLLGITADALRYPWNTCALAGSVLDELVGEPLSHAHQLSTRIDMSSHCTHMFELAALTMAQARRGGDRRYDISVADHSPDTQQGPLLLNAVLKQDGEEVLHWSTRDETIVSPPEWASREIIAGFRQRLGELDPEAAERAWVLRRAVWLARGDRSFQQVTFAAQTGLGPVCFTYQPKRAIRARAMPGSRRSGRRTR